MWLHNQPHLLKSMEYKKVIDLAAWSLFILLLLFTGSIINTSMLSADTPISKDFVAFWAAAKLSIINQPENAYNIHKMQQVIGAAVSNEASYTWMYPPTFQALFYPLGLTSYRNAFMLFMSITAATFMISLSYFCRPEHRMVALSAPTLFIGIIFGQNSLITASLGMLSIALMKRRPRLSGVAMGLLSIKPHLFICLPLFALVEKNWRVFLWALITSISLIIYSLLLLGPSPWYSFFENAQKASIWLQDGTLKIDSMTSIAANLLLFGQPLKLAMAAHLASFILLLAIVWLIFKNTKNTNLRGASVIVLIINLSPYMFIYELAWLSVALVFMLNSPGWNRWENTIIGVCWLFPLADFIFNSALEKSFSLTFAISYTLTLIILSRAKKDSIYILSNQGSRNL